MAWHHSQFGRARKELETNGSVARLSEQQLINIFSLILLVCNYARLTILSTLAFDLPSKVILPLSRSDNYTGGFFVQPKAHIDSRAHGAAPKPMQR